MFLKAWGNKWTLPPKVIYHLGNQIATCKQQGPSEKELVGTPSVAGSVAA